ncbi:MAG: serine/threonine protein kinase [Fibrobacteria bacterium]|nr:serine/threonine protein kinase [Fibrobacteria bacterium]
MNERMPMTAPTRLLESGDRLGNYTILKVIGKGSMGAVYTAWQEGLSRQVALKVLMKDRFDQLVTAERFLLEAETAANLSHPNIVTVFGQGERTDCIWFAMQFIEGPSLSEWLRRRGRHPIPSRRRIQISEIRDLARQLLEALDHAHQQGVIHRDIKPENILWAGNTGRAIVTDFGLSSVNYVTHEAEKHFILGSPLYVSPEQARGDALDGRADLFSLGCVLTELALGFLPVRVERPEKIFRTRASEDPAMFTGTPRDHQPDLPEEWDKYLRRALSPNKNARWPDARTMLSALPPA